jgi:hypothetical protein
MLTTAPVEVDCKPLRWAGGAMLGAAAVRPFVGSPGVPCILRSTTGIPCPLCGMTRGVTAAVHGDFARAALMNPGSLLLVAAAVVLALGWRRRSITFPAWLPYALIAGLWAFQLFKYATGRPL